MRGKKEFYCLPGEFDPAETSDFNVVIAYDTSDAARRALQLVDGLAEQLGDEFNIHRNLWRFDILAVSAAREAARADAANAHLILVATDGQAELPRSVTWLEAWSAQSIPGAAALAALLLAQPVAAKGESSVRRFLQAAATKGGQNFFAHELEIRPRSQRTSRTSGRILEHKSRPARRPRVPVKRF